MQALILAGGKGTRLRPLTLYTPKPIVPIANRPFLIYQIETLRNAGISDIILSLNYQPDKIQQVLDDGAEFGVKLRYLTEPNPMGTAGAYRFAADFLHETTVVFNGDILTDLDLHKVITQHQEREATATIVLTPVENPSAYGLVETETDGRVKRFLEKPSMEEIERLKINTINAGTYILEPKVLDYIPSGESYSFEYGLFPDLLKRQEPFYAYIPDAENYWLDIGTPERYLQAHKDFVSGKVRHLTLEDTRHLAEISHTAEINERSYISKDCIIKPGAKIINSFLGHGVHVEEKAVIENSVIWSHTRINNNAQISNSIIGRGCHIGRFCLVTNGAVIGDKTSLTDYTQV